MYFPCLWFSHLSFIISGTELKDEESGTKVVRETKREHFNCIPHGGIIRARPIEITIKKRWFPTLKPRVSIKISILGMVKSDLDALAPCASKPSELFLC